MHFERFKAIIAHINLNNKRGDELYQENEFGYARQCICSEAVHLHFGNVAPLLSYPEVFDFSAFISGTVVQEPGMEDRDARCIYLPTRDLSIMFAVSYRELLMLDEILSQTLMIIEIDKLLSN